jgi:hypothetical protein
VCGCDNLTYWNAATAIRDYGVNIKASGPCAAPVACTGGGKRCPSNGDCNFEVPGAVQCVNLGNATGTCWGLPKTCATPAGKFTSCNGSRCRDRCTSIRDQRPFYTDATCP